MITYHTNLILNVYYFVCWLATGKRYSSRDKISNKIPVALILDFVVMTKPKGQSRVAVGARQFQNNKKTNKQTNKCTRKITAVWQCKSWKTCLRKSTTCSGCIPYDDLDTHQGDKDSFDHCLVSNWEGLVRVSLLWDKQHQNAIVRKSTSIEGMKNLKFGVDRANIEQDSAIYKLENL